MHSEVVVIERTFNLYHDRWSRGGPKRMSLGVVASGERHANLVVDGWPDVRTPSTVTAFFRAPGDWRQLVGWVDHATGEVVAAFPEAPWLNVAMAGLLAGAWLVFLFGRPWLWTAALGVRVGLLTGTALLMLLVSRMIWRTRRTRAERSVLEACGLGIRRTLTAAPAKDAGANCA